MFEECLKMFEECLKMFADDCSADISPGDGRMDVFMRSTPEFVEKS